MSFWNLSSGEAAKETTTFEQDGGGFEDIPNNTTVQAYIEEVKWAKGYQTEAEYINVRWRVLAPNAYANRIIFQKLWVNGDEPRAKDPIKKGDNAKRMLAAIDSNCGGGLMKLQSMPQDQDLQANLLQKPMNIKVMQWKMKDDNGDEKTGNWISMVSPRAAVVEPVKAAVAQSAPVSTAEEIGDSIPF